MNKKHMVFRLILFAVLALSIPSASLAEETEYEAYNVTIQMGSDETELNFTWFTENPTNIPQLAVCKYQHLKNGTFVPQKTDYYEGEYEIVVVESGGGGPGGPPSDMMTTQEETDDEEENEIYACKVTMTNVRKNTKYAYAVGNGENFSKIYNFDTENPNNYSFIFVGDPQIGASRDEDSDAEGWRKAVTAALAKFEDTDFILSAGDQVERSTSDTQYDLFFSATELTSIPFAPAIGNHDTSDLYSYHFNVPNESELGYTSGGGDYWFTYGNTLFMVLNTNNSSALSHSEFMAQAINVNSDAKWRVVVFHHSLYSSARHVDDVNNLRLSLAPVIDEHDIDVVLAGHDHFYARTHQISGDLVDEACYTSTGRDGQEQTTCVDMIGEVVPEEDLEYDSKGRVKNPNGTVYFTANSASGSKYYDFTEIEGYTNYYIAAYDASKTASYLNVEVQGVSLTVSAYSVDTGERIDTYSIHKNVD